MIPFYHISHFQIFSIDPRRGTLLWRILLGAIGHRHGKVFLTGRKNRRKLTHSSFPGESKMRIAFIGNAQSGKTTLLNILENLPFRKAYSPTEEPHKVTIKGNEIWDCPGDERYAPLRRHYLEATERIYVFLDRSETVPDLSAWKTVIDELCPCAEIIVVFSKMDLNPKNYFYLPSWLENRHILEVSSRKGTGVIQFYESL